MKAKWIVRRREKHTVTEQECWTDGFAWHTFTEWCARFPEATISQICKANGRIVRKMG